MGRAPCCDKVGLKKGRWTAQEDRILIDYINQNGEGSWRSMPKNAGLLRCGKSCRLRWINYLRSDLKRGNFTSLEEDIIIKLHASHGNKWSLIANQLPGRTDNEIKNYWNSTLSRRFDTFRSRPSSASVAGVLPKNLISNLLASEGSPEVMSNNNGPAAAAVQGVILKKRAAGGRTSRAAMQKNKSSTNDRSNKSQQVATVPHACESNPNINSFNISGSSHLSRSSSSSLISPSHGYGTSLPQTPNECRLSSSSLESLVLDPLLFPCQNDNQRTSVHNQQYDDDELVKLGTYSCDMLFDGLVNFDDAELVRLDDEPSGFKYATVNEGNMEVTMGPLLDSPIFNQAADYNITGTTPPGFVDCEYLAGSEDWDWENIVHKHADHQIWPWDHNQQHNHSRLVERNLKKDEERREALVAWLLS